MSTPIAPTSEWKGVSLEAWITSTTTAGGKRVRLKVKRISTKKLYFSWQKRMFQIDPEKIFLFAKRPILLYDITYAEPLSQTDRRQLVKPENPGLEAHYSEPLEVLIKGQSLRQVIGAVKDVVKSNNWMIWVMLAIGALLGYFMGNALPIQAFMHVVPAT